MLASLAVGVLGVQAGLAQSKALASADADTRQLVGIQDVRNDLVVADAGAVSTSHPKPGAGKPDSTFHPSESLSCPDLPIGSARTGMATGWKPGARVVSVMA